MASEVVDSALPQMPKSEKHPWFLPYKDVSMAPAIMDASNT